MKAVPVKLLALGLAIVLGAAALQVRVQPAESAAQRLQVDTAVQQTTADMVQLQISWHWNSPTPRWSWRGREQLLAVDFDSRRAVFDSEEASAGPGADGEVLRRLEAVAGPDGTRRLFVIRDGEDGTVRVNFRPVRSDGGSTGPFRVYVVFEDGAEVWVREAELGATATYLAKK